jgi:hypothetical protein
MNHCADCARPGRYRFQEQATGVVSRYCGQHAYPRLAKGSPPGFTVIIEKPLWSPPKPIDRRAQQE